MVSPLLETVLSRTCPSVADQDEMLSIISSLLTGVIEERLLRCLALDLINANVDPDAISKLLMGVPKSARPAAILSVVTEYGLDQNPVACAVRNTASWKTRPVLVAALHGTKAVKTFRGGDTTEDAIQQLAASCRAFRNGRRPIGALANPLRGFAPVVWVTDAEKMGMQLTGVADLDRAETVMRWLGLPLDPGIYHVFLLWYPLEFEHSNSCAKPNIFAENWVGSGLYVSDGSDSPWGYTCEVGGGIGGPELIHPTLNSLSGSKRFDLEYLGKGTASAGAFALTALEECRRRCAEMSLD